MPKTPLDVQVFKGPTRRYRSILRRADGVAVELWIYDEIDDVYGVSARQVLATLNAAPGRPS
jgi:hypothetical protein